MAGSLQTSSRSTCNSGNATQNYTHQRDLEIVGDWEGSVSRRTPNCEIAHLAPLGTTTRRGE